MIKEVSTKLLGQFVDCLEERLAADAVDVDAPEPAQVATTATAEDAAETAPGPAPRVVAVAAPAEPVDLMSLAGGSIAKRLVPLAVGVAVIAVVVYVLRR
jgi:uncharacterized protein